ncbi:glutamine--fructose-6-phosphate transaminase (isomerizing) [Halobacteriales archaeon QH_8_64_26]|nr:MAG: glutamine--fructose-6-phosphate transaminase (isomerizing) [Halobacteriales archaeon QH_8_64_26]
MCGIIGCVGRQEETLDVLLHGLSKLEYRGYDSAGVALAGKRDAVDIEKRAGKLENLQEALEGVEMQGTVGIGHTRWSTHGPPTDSNAHPHADCEGQVAVLHNGIIENFQEIRDELVASGHDFASDTDTEVVPHLIEDALAEGASPEAAFREALSRIEGSYAIAAIFTGTEAAFCARQDSPLVLGLDADAYYLASDVPAFRDYTDQVIYMEDGEVARLDPDGWAVTDSSGALVEKDPHVVEWDAKETGKSGYDHYMIKEVHEQPRALRECLRGRVDELGDQVQLEEFAGLAPPSSVQFVACGTSYHAALYGAQLFREAGVPAQAFLASEYRTSPPPIGSNLVIGITQSGETADTLSALREASRRGAPTLAVTNVVGSSAARECDHTLYIRAGPEIGVAASKTFASQLAALNVLSLAITRTGDSREAIGALRDLPSAVQEVLDESTGEAVAKEYIDADAYFFIGRGYQYPVALEGALKMKEITYKHAEGFAAGELKHGPLALVTERTPVIAIAVGDGDAAQKTVGNIKEVEARNASVIAVTDGESGVERYADHVLPVPESHPRTAAVTASVQLQLLAYHSAAQLGRSIDKPRNLAKSVTVE